MKKVLSLSFLLLTSTSWATKAIPLDQKIGNIITIETTPLSNLSVMEDDKEKEEEKGDGIERTKNVIAVAKDLIALGEKIYEIVKKGKPTTKTDFTAVSVVPRNQETKEYVDPFDLEGFSMPLERSFSTRITNGLGKEVVRFDYIIVYSYGGSWNGSGKYLTNVIVAPKNIKVTSGWEFNASMKLAGIMNHGTKSDPVAGAMVNVNYQMSSVRSAFERTDVIHLTGRGEIKSFGAH